jgi:hypothetical protein
MGMVRAGARDLDMWPGICPELKLGQRRKGEQQQRSRQHIQCGPPECGWKNAGALLDDHDR